MHFLLTRPEADNQALAQNLIDIGHGVTSEPLLKINYFDSETINLTPFKAVLFTSTNGVRALIHTLPDSLQTPTILCFAVGDATARKAAEAGFQTIHSAAGNVDDLAEIVIQSLTPNDGPLLHISGKDIAGNLVPVLEQAGFNVISQQLYQATKAQKLSPESQEMILSGMITHIPFYSPRTAKTFANLIQSSNLSPYLTKISAVCLSPAVSDMIDLLPWQSIIIAPQPNQHSLFKMIGIKLEEDRQ